MFMSPSGYSLGVASGVNNATIVSQGGGNLSGFASLCYFTSDWNQNINSVVNRANSASFVVNYNGSDRFYVLGSGTVYANGQYFGSDIRLKRNIKPLEGALSKVLKLQGVTYQWNEEKRCATCDDKTVLQSDQSTQMGFIAQEVEKVVPEVVRDMPTGTKAVAYANLVSLLVEGMKEQQKTIVALEDRVIALREEMDALKKGETIKATGVQSGTLRQSIPNPADAEVEIGYSVSNKSDKAQLEIVDLNGLTIKSVPLDNAKKKIVLEKGALTPGVYIYKLILNGKMIDSKKMIIK